MSKRGVIENYDREGEDYDKIRYGRTKGGEFFSHLELTETLRLMKPSKVLHIGTATGRVSTYITSRHYDYVGIEISRVMSRITRDKLNGKGSVVRADAEHLPFRHRTFDTVVCVRSFHFLPNPRQFLFEANRVVRSNGRVIVSFEKRVPGRRLLERARLLPTHRAKRFFYLNSEAALLVSKAGFRVFLHENITRLPLLFYWRYRGDFFLRTTHHRLPRWFGTVGLVIGSKTSERTEQDNFLMNLDAKTPTTAEVEVVA